MSTRPFRGRTRVTADEVQRRLGGATRARGITVPCLRLGASLRFYTDILGLRLVGQAGGHAIVDAGPVRLVLLDAELVPGFTRQPGQGVYLELAIADLDRLAERLSDAGVAVPVPRVSRTGRVVSVEDPEGNLVSLIEEAPVHRA